ncbi:MAG: hypothetical protein OXU62_05355 [Gammaproteobacteria bacterium]|nr:hypothetical protein [Gammaproteobacteria bacterium]
MIMQTRALRQPSRVDSAGARRGDNAPAARVDAAPTVTPPSHHARQPSPRHAAAKLDTIAPAPGRAAIAAITVD